MLLYVSYQMEAVEHKGNEIKEKNIKRKARERASKNPMGTHILRKTL